MRLGALACVGVSALWLACGETAPVSHALVSEDAGLPQGGSADSGTPDDAGTPAPPADAGTPPPADAGSPPPPADAGTPPPPADAGSPPPPTDAGTPPPPADAGSPPPPADAGTPPPTDAGSPPPPTDAGTPPGTLTQLSSGELASALALDADNVYWAAHSSTDEQTGTIRGAPKAGGKPFTVGFYGGYSPQYLAVNGAGTFFTNSSGQGLALQKVLSNGNSGAMTRPDLGQFALTPGLIYFPMNGGIWWINTVGDEINKLADAPAAVTGIAAAFGKVYWSDANGLHAVSTSDGSVQDWSFPMSLVGLRINDGWVLSRSYPALAQNASVVRLAPDGSSQATIGFHDLNEPPDLDANANVAYWNNRACIMRAIIDPPNTDSSTCVPGADAPGQYSGVRVDDSAIYFIRNGDVFKLTK